MARIELHVLFALCLLHVSFSAATACYPIRFAPTTLTGYSAYLGKCVEFNVTGATYGAVWGSDIYTANSTLSKAAVHAGVLRPGLTGRVQVRLLPGQRSYLATTRNGVTTYRCASHVLSFEFIKFSAPVETCLQVSSTPSSLSGYSAHVGKCLEFAVTGAASGIVWGSGIYTADSSVSKAAVHAGVAGVGQTRLVRVRVLPGQSGYLASTQNGVTSNKYAAYVLSFQFIGSREAPNACTPVSATPQSLSGYSAHVGKCFQFLVTGGVSGTVWGSRIYTADSTLSLAAVHAGAVRIGETRPVSVRILPGQGAYQSTLQNGISSRNYAAYILSFEIVNPSRG